MTNFNSFGLSETLLTSLNNMHFKEPTPVQKAAIPLALQGRDILGSAQTGTGKTGAFAIPLIEMLIRNPEKIGLVLTPTRELAKQVLDAIHMMLGKQLKMNTAFIIGGDPYGKQMAQLRNRPRIIVGTPGRINDHLERKTLDLSKTGFLVLDETDRMLDMGFGVQLDRINTFLPATRQTMLFSATIPQEIVRISQKYLTNPERISVGESNIVAPKIKQEIIRIGQEKKYDEMARQLNTREGSVIIFVKTKFGTEKMAKRLREDGFTADALHGDLRQRKREQVMQAYRNQKFRILVATDIAARGLDVPHIAHVINHDLPQVAEDYIHRMGRTARAGAEGSALCFISPADYKKWREIEQLLGIKSEGSNDNRGGRSEGRSRGAGFGGAGKGGFAKKKTWGDKPRFEKTGDAKPAWGNKPKFEKSGDGERPAAKKTWGDKPRFEKSGDAKPAWGNKPKFEKSSDGERPAAKKTWGDKPRFEKTGDAKPAWGNKPKFEKSGDGERPAAKKTWGDKPAGKKAPFTQGGFKKKFDAKPSSGARATARPAYKGKRTSAA